MVKKINSYYRPEGMMTREQASEYLGLAKATLYWLHKKGILVGQQIEGAGRVTYYQNEDVQRFRSDREGYVSERIRETYNDPQLKAFFSDCGKKGRGKKKTFSISTEKLSEIKRKASLTRWAKEKNSGKA